MPLASASTVSFARTRKDARVVTERATHVGVVGKKVEEFAAGYTPPPPPALPRGLDPISCSCARRCGSAAGTNPS
jgi:hypothetical protein